MARFRVLLAPATLDDLDLLVTWNAALRADERATTAMSAPQLRARMRQWVRGKAQVLLLCVAGERAGYCVVIPQGRRCYLRQFFVSRPFRRRGVGRAAVSALHRLLHPARIELDVLVWNTPASAFWRSQGFAARFVRMTSDPGVTRAEGKRSRAARR